MNRSDLDQLTFTLIHLDADGSVIDAADLNRTLRDQAGVTAQRASSSIARVARAMRGGLSSVARRQARRRDRLNDLALAAGWLSWYEYQTAVVNGRAPIPPASSV